MLFKGNRVITLLGIVFISALLSGESCVDIGTPTEPDEPSSSFSCFNLRISPDPSYVGRSDSVRFTWDRDIVPKRTCRRVLEIGGFLDRDGYSSRSSSTDLTTYLSASSISRVTGYGTFTCYVYYEDENGNFSSKASRSITIRP